MKTVIVIFRIVMTLILILSIVESILWLGIFDVTQTDKIVHAIQFLISICLLLVIYKI